MTRIRRGGPTRVLAGALLLGALLLTAQIAGASARTSTAQPESRQRAQDFYIHLASPANGTQIAWHQGMEVDFTWGTNFYCTDPGCPIKLAIGTDPNVSQTVYDQQVGSNCVFGSCPSSAAVTTLLPGTYYWHVYAVYCCGQVYSEIWSFTLTGTVPPSVTSFAPTSGEVGTAVTISGSGFTGATAVNFNGVGATFNVTNDKQITTTVPSGATSGPISVTNPGGTGTSSASFTVTTPTPPPPPPPTGKPVLRHWYITSGGPKAGSSFSILLNIVNSETGDVALGGRVVCSAHLGGLLLVPTRGKFVSSLDGYACTWRMPFDSAGKRFTATDSVKFAAAHVTVSNPLYRATVKAPQGAKLVLIGTPAHAAPVAGEDFQASQSARLQFPNGSQKPIDWKASGTSATCGGSVPGTVERFSTGIRCTWLIPLAAKGRTLVFVLTIHALGQTKQSRFTAHAG